MRMREGAFSLMKSRGALRATIEPLDAGPQEVLDAVDRLLEAARPDLVPRRGHLEPALERALDASCDTERLVLIARTETDVLGLLDARIGWPSPETLVVAQIAVIPEARRRGVARALLWAGVTQAVGLGLPIARVSAGVLPGRGAAAQFWLALGLEPAAEPSSFEGPVSLLEAARALDEAP